VTISDLNDRFPIGTFPLPLKKETALPDSAARAATMETLHRGIGAGLDQAPTLKSVRRINNLVSAFHEIRNRRAVGCDGIPYKAYLEPLKYARLDPNFLIAYPELKPFQTIHQSLLFNAYPDPVQTKTIRGGRKVQVGTVRNRIVEGAFARKLTAHFERFFADSSCAFRRGKRPEEVASKIRSLIRQGNHWCWRTDIEKFFASVARDILLKQLDDSILDKQLIEFIFEAISPFQLLGREFVTSGLPTGNALCPLLSNLHLHRFDLACSHLSSFRYVDDILVLGKSRETVEEAKKHIELLLASLGLRLNPKKTDTYDLHRESVVFLGYEFRGGNVYPSDESIEKLERRLRVWGQKAHRDPIPANRSMVSIMKGFVRRFRVGPIRKLFKGIDRRLIPLYPAGVTLTGRWDEIRAIGKSKVNKGVKATNVGLPRGGAASCSTEKARIGLVPTVEKAAGEPGCVQTDSPVPHGTLDGD
jgi:hypothetical protein